MSIPILGLPKFPSELDYQYSFTEELDQDISVSSFQSGISTRNLQTSHRRRTFNLKFKTVKESTMNILQQFYKEIGGPLKPFIFEPPIEKFSRYTQMLQDGSQILSTFENAGSLRAGTQSFVVRFTDNFSRTLFKPLLESTGLVLEEVLGENPKGKYMHLDGLLESQQATITDEDQDFLDLGTDDFMIDFLFRAETVYISQIASYAGLTGLTLIFTIDGTPHTVTFTAAATDAASVVQEINNQQGDFVEAQVFGTTELKIFSVADDGFFTITGTAVGGLDLLSHRIVILEKTNGSISFNCDILNSAGSNLLIFEINDGVTSKQITADASFFLADGSWHYIAITCDRDGNGQIYVDAVASGAAIDISSVGSIDNTGDFLINNDVNVLSNFDIDRIGIWNFGSGGLPADIATRIATLNDDWFRIDNDDGLDILYTFDKSDGRDDKQQEDLTLLNDPTFIDFEVAA